MRQGSKKYRRFHIKPSQTEFPWLFLLMGFGIAWLFWIPVAFTGQDYQSSPLLLLAFMMGVFGPGIAGIILNYVENSREGRRDFWQRMFELRRVRPIWAAIIIFLWPLLHIVANLSSNLLGGKIPDSELLKQIAAQPLVIPVVVILYFVQAGLEELGWRGYMLERLQKSMSPVKSSLVIGVFHSLWHLPLFWVVGTNQIKMGFGIEFIFFILFVVASSVYSTWCYLDNGHSTLAVTLLHCTGNLSLDIFVFAFGTLKNRFYILLMALGAVLIILAWARGQGKNAEAGLGGFSS